MAVRSVVIEADGGSRGNPGPAAYGAVLKDAQTGEVIAEDATRIGVASNNVAEYRGLIAGLELAREHTPGAEIEVRMDSKLVVEQMSGRWKVKHPDMKPLAAQARRLAPIGTTFTWVPRAENHHADRLVNDALDGLRDGVRVGGRPDESLVAEVESPTATTAPTTAPTAPPTRGWGRASGTPTTLILLRHGVTVHTLDKRFSGGLGGANPGLSDDGRAQIRLAAQWLAPTAERVEAVVTSPVRRTRESAEIAAAILEAPVVEEPGFAEMEFGVWDGLTFAEVGTKYPDQLAAWIGSLDAAPEGGESFRAVERRVLAGLDRTLRAYAGRSVVVVSHVTPIKVLVAQALGAPLDAVFAMELAPASVSVVSYYPDPDRDAPRPSLRLFNALPPAGDAFPTAAKQW